MLSLATGAQAFAQEDLLRTTSEAGTRGGKLVIAHANYDPSSGVLKQVANLNIDEIFGTANDLVVPFAGAAIFDPNVFADQEIAYGSATVAKPNVLHTNFFGQPEIRMAIEQTFG